MTTTATAYHRGMSRSAAINHNWRQAPAMNTADTTAPANPVRVRSGMSGATAASGSCARVVSGVKMNPITDRLGLREYRMDSAAWVRERASPR